MAIGGMEHLLGSGMSLCPGWRVSSMWGQGWLFLFGANCKEDHQVVKQFTQQLASKIEEIEKKTYTVSNKQVTFTFELIPSDMKFLAFLNGELNNAATYFSSFANVSKEDCFTLNGTFGPTNDCKWKPWSYKEKLRIAKQVESFKAKLPTQGLESLARKTVEDALREEIEKRFAYKLLNSLLCFPKVELF